MAAPAIIVRRARGSDGNLITNQSYLWHVLFWLIGTTDGHGKNFSIFLRPGGRYRMTPFYDILTAQPSLDSGQIRHNQMELAMSVGNTNHYRINTIARRHFIETGRNAGLTLRAANTAVDELAGAIDGALDALARQLPKGFPEFIHESVGEAIRSRARLLS